MTESAATALRATMDAALERRDHEAAVRAALDAVREGSLPIVDLYTLVLGPLLASIGGAWAHGTERVWEEHFASHAIRTIVESLYLDVRDRVAEVPPLGKTVLLACPPKEQHELGLRMLADRFALAGYDVVFLGADTPLEEIVAAAQATGASLVALSVATVFERVAFGRFVSDLRAALPDTRIVVGGPAFATEEHWPAEDFLDTTELGLSDPSAAG